MKLSTGAKLQDGNQHWMITIFAEFFYTDKTPAIVGEQRGMLYSWAKVDKFYGSFTYDAKGTTRLTKIPAHQNGLEHPKTTSTPPKQHVIYHLKSRKSLLKL